MEKITYRFSLDVHKNGIQRTLQGFETGDTKSRCVEISLVESGQTYNLPQNGVGASLYVTLPNGTQNIEACTIENNVIRCDLNTNDAASEGIVVCQLKVYSTINEGEVIVCPKFQLEVWESTISDSQAIASGTYTSLTEALMKANYVYSNGRILSISWDENLTLTVEYGMVPDWSNTHRYSANDKCFYNGKVWKCLAECEDVIPVEGTYWTELSIDEGRIVYETDVFKQYMDNFESAAIWGHIVGDLSDQTDLKDALDSKQDILTFDDAPTEGSSNPVTSDGIYETINNLDIKTYSAGNGMTLTPTNKFKVGTRWNAVTKGRYWSRLYWADAINTGEGTSGILAISCTRTNVVRNFTFLITTGTSSTALTPNIIQLSGAHYYNITPIASLFRLVYKNNGDYYFEVYDEINVETGQEQTWHCCFIPLTEASLTTYTAFTDGTTVPSGYTAGETFYANVDENVAAIRKITRSGTTFTAERQDGTTFTFTQKDTTYSDATQSTHGLMSAADKTKLDEITLDTNGNLSVVGNMTDGSGNTLSSVAAVAGFFTSAVSCAVGATSATISNAGITATSVIEVYCDNQSGTGIPIASITATSGQAVVTFDALTEATSFKLHVRNP